jgi:fucose permease
MKSSKIKLTKTYKRLDSEIIHSKANDENNIPLLSANNSSIAAYNFLSFRQLVRMPSFWLIMMLFFIYGGLICNFIIFMPDYLESRITSDNLNQKNFLVELFFSSFIIGRCLTLLFARDLGYNYYNIVFLFFIEKYS